MYQAITTTYKGATDHRGARIIARSGSGIRTAFSYDHALDGPQNHVAAAEKLARKLEWSGDWHGGSTTEGYCFVCVVKFGASKALWTVEKAMP